MTPLFQGFGLIFFAAVAGGAFAVPLKMQRRYQWENTWMLGFLFALVIIPFTVVTIFFPLWPSAVKAAGIGTLITAMAFGFLWGCGALSFAVGITATGLSIGYAVIMGVSTAVGSVIPMLRKWDAIPAPARVVVLIGIALCVAGVAICGKAGAVRERLTTSQSPAGTGPGGSGPAGFGKAASGSAASRAFLIGLSWCLLSGFLSACANLGFDFADRVALEAQRLGAGSLAASIGRWLPLYWGGYTAIFLGSAYTMLKKGTWRNFIAPAAGRDFVLAIVLGCCHFLAQIPYGMGAYFLGGLGTTVGWAVNIASSLMVANVFGFITGEWKNAPPGSVRTLYGGLAVLVLAMVVLAYGNSLAAH